MVIYQYVNTPSHNNYCYIHSGIYIYLVMMLRVYTWLVFDAGRVYYAHIVV